MDARFRHHWTTWRALIAEGRTPGEFLAECSDETLVELLAYRDEGNDVERNVIATELTNRITRLHHAVEGHAGRVRGFLDENERHRASAEAGARTASANAEQAASDLVKAGEADNSIRRETDDLEGTTRGTARYTGRKPRDGGW